MSHNPASMNPPDRELRTCPGCNFAVNFTEWRLCKKVGCALAFSDMPASNKEEVVVAPIDISLENKRAFLAARGLQCPFCRSTEVWPETDADQVEDDKVTRFMTCNEGHFWHEVYTLTGVLTDPQHATLYPNNP